ncbi:MAG: hypothetical protein ACJ76S_06895 [Solirubrobacteraceae bacterium]|jgi:hypothetical protein
MFTEAADTALSSGAAGRVQRRRSVGGLMMIGRNFVAVLLIPITVVGTAALAAAPFAWILVVSKLIEAFSLPPLIALPALIVAIPASMIGGLKLLLRVSDLYERLRGHDEAGGRVAPVWRRGLTDTQQARPVRMLDVVMVISACVAIAALCIWFIAFAGTTVRL